MKRRSKYSPEFKTEAIKMVLNEGKPIHEVGESLGVHHTSIRDWIKKYNKDGAQSFTGNGN